MNPVDPKDQSGFNLPTPGQDSGNSGAQPPVDSTNMPGNTPTKSPSSNPISPLPAVTPPASVPQTLAMPALDDSNPQIAEDSDLIEQEWVDKAKAIVEHTKTDPYRQNVEINKMKADYIRKRYGKELKTPNE